MRRIFILSILCTLLGAAGSRSQELPHLPQFLARNERFNRLYNENHRAGVNLAALDPLRQQIEAGFKNGDIPSMIETISRATAVLEGVPWNERQRFLSSLSLEADRAVVEPNQEVQVSLARIFPTNLEQAFQTPPTVTFEVKPAESVPAGDPGEIPAALLEAKHAIIGDHLPFSNESTIATRRLRLPDGAYQIVARIEASGKSIAEFSIPVYAINDFTEQIGRLSSLISVIKNSTEPKVKAVAALVTTPEYRLKRLAQLNKSQSDPPVDVPAELQRVEYLLSSLAKGVNPLTKERGELERAYQMADGKLMPYRVYVPLGYDGSVAVPLVVMLHGALGDERSYFSGLYDPVVIKGESERRGIILVSTNAGSRFSTYDQKGQDDVFEVINAIQRDYKIDPARVYLTGHSLGAVGTWVVAAARPEMFAAIAPVAGAMPVRPEEFGALLQKIKAIPALVTHGAKDGIAPVDNSRKLVAIAQKAGLKVEYIEVPDSDHTSVVGTTFPAVMQFFERNRKAAGK